MSAKIEKVNGSFLEHYLPQEVLLEILEDMNKTIYCSGYPPGTVSIESISLQLNIDNKVKIIDSREVWIDSKDYRKLSRKILSY